MITILLAGALVAAGAGCGNGARAPGERNEMPERSIEAVQEAHTEVWMAIPGVVGTGIGRCDGEPCIVVYATERSDRLEADLPDEVEGYRVRLEVTGQFRARDSAGG